jgi:uncharacterized glyoxalase superfamily protein PhnB
MAMPTVISTVPSTDPKAAISGVTPYINVDGAAAAAEFYQRAFAAEDIARIPADDGKRLIHCHLRINGGPLLLSDPFPEHGHPLKTPQSFTLHLQVDDADAWFARAVTAGAEPVLPVQLMFWGDRYGLLRDPYGVTWSVGSPNR